MTNGRWGWVRDWAWIGASTSAVSPLIAEELLPIELTTYAAVASVVGGVTGAAVGWGMAAALDRVPERSRVSMVAVLAPIPLGAWGALVATVSAALTPPDLAPLALACGSVAALVQTLWLAPLYVWLVGRGWLRLPLVVGGALVTPLGGVLATLAGLTAMDGVDRLRDLGVL